MSQKKSMATRRSISVLKQIVSGILPGWKIAEFAANEKIKSKDGGATWCFSRTTSSGLQRRLPSCTRRGGRSKR